MSRRVTVRIDRLVLPVSAAADQAAYSAALKTALAEALGGNLAGLRPGTVGAPDAGKLKNADDAAAAGRAIASVITGRDTGGRG